MFKRNESMQSFLEEDHSAPANAHIQPPAAKAVAAIGASITVRGDITGDEDLLIQGTVEGSLELPDNDLTVGSEGRVKANLKALKIDVQGEVVGDLHGLEKVIVRKSGKVAGNIVAPRVVLEDGCRFKGTVDMDTTVESRQSGPKSNVTKQSAEKAATAAGSRDSSGPVATVVRASHSG